ncbi:hypothetical protein ACFWZ1_12450 [Frateuria sp. GZRe14]|uniref:hypothetical protein n=1 Tax=Frateuria sp. GZRe14 TaxID=3351534 RepID=UPI003EDC9E24
MEAEELTFSALERRIEQAPEHPSYRMSPSRRARWGNGVGIAAALLGLILANSLPASRVVLFVTSALLAVELLAFAIAWTADFPNLIPAKERRQYAETLDFDMPHHLEILAWLGRFPRERIGLLSAYCAHRLDRMRSKLPLLTGSLEKLGILPLAAGVFLQLKDLPRPMQMQWPQILLIAFLMLCYWAGVLQLSLRFRLELYDTLLKQALDGQSNGIQPQDLKPWGRRRTESAL